MHYSGVVKKMALELQQISLITEQGVVRSQKKTPHIYYVSA